MSDYFNDLAKSILEASHKYAAAKSNPDSQKSNWDCSTINRELAMELKEHLTKMNNQTERRIIQELDLDRDK